MKMYPKVCPDCGRRGSTKIEANKDIPCLRCRAKRYDGVPESLREAMSPDEIADYDRVGRGETGRLFWRDAHGTVMPIAAMDDHHLCMSLRLVYRRSHVVHEGLVTEWMIRGFPRDEWRTRTPERKP